MESHARGGYIVCLEIGRMLSDGRTMDGSHIEIELGGLGGIDAGVLHVRQVSVLGMTTLPACKLVGGACFGKLPRGVKGSACNCR